DYVIIDTPPTAMLSDTTAYREVADAVLLVVRQDYTEQKEIRRALEAIADVNLPIAGYVLNGAAEGTNAYGYGNYGGYGYRGYGYGYGDNYKNTKKKKEKV
ncbi:MAG: exopolysaccharide biosynthesis protein, partial [bacterium]|nr:exopolysaccharide biosynthesis protein [bacterium]